MTEHRRQDAVAADTFEVTVHAVTPVAEDCVEIILQPANGTPLPDWAPGAHIDVILGPDLTRQYSLCGDPADNSNWRLGVLREQQSRGGSEFLHESVRAGSTLTVRGPRNHFAIQPSGHYLFIAGGIGITPILTMIRAAETAGAQWKLLYGGRRRASMAFQEELKSHGDKVLLRPQDEYGLLDLTAFFADAEEGTAVYCCGPEPLIAAVEKACAAASLPLHVERFAAKPQTEATTNTEFEVVCAESGVTVTVPANSTILAEVRKAGIEVLSSCSEGTCGTCEADVLEGTPEHRDSVLTPEERKAGESMMICVSRCKGKRLVLDL